MRFAANTCSIATRSPTELPLQIIFNLYPSQLVQIPSPHEASAVSTKSERLEVVQNKLVPFNLHYLSSHCISPLRPSRRKILRLVRHL